MSGDDWGTMPGERNWAEWDVFSAEDDSDDHFLGTVYALTRDAATDKAREMYRSAGRIYVAPQRINDA